MGQFAIYAWRLLEWLCLWIVGHGIILWLATKGIYPDRAVSTMLTGVETAPAWVEWLLAGGFGLFGVFLLEKFLWPFLAPGARAETTIPQGVPPKIIETVTNAATAKRDTKMSQAMAYVMLRQWGKNFMQAISEPEQSDGATVPYELRQAALDGDVLVWGKISSTSPYIDIPKDYWKKWGIEWFSSLKNESKTENESGLMGGEIYYDLMVSKAEIEKKWPPKA